MVYIRFDKNNKAEFILYQYIKGESNVDLNAGFIFDEIPEPEERENKVSVLKLNDKDNTLYYEYEDIVKSEEMTLIEEVEKLREELKKKDERLEQIESDNADILFDSLKKDMRIEQLESDIADILLTLI